jgi:filamin/ABP280 repeat protein/calcineurin-like phosphoesterase family protein
MGKLTHVLAGVALVGLTLSLLGCSDPTRPSFGTTSTTVSPPLLWAAGDIATCEHQGDFLTAALIGTVPEATVVTLGDNAYETGSASDYANCYDPSWGQFKSRTRPALGNHEYHAGNAIASFDYFGDAAWGNSRPNGYYSFNLGEWHIIVLNDNPPYVPIGSGSAQVSWLKADLSANTKECVLALWHQPLFYSEYPGHPPGYLAGRKPLWSTLYAAQADLVLNGHRHVYERYGLQDPDGNATAQGIRQITVGTGGAETWDPPTVSNANAEVVHGGTAQFGVLKLTLENRSYSWEYIPVGENTFTDQGTTACHTGSLASASRSTATVPNGVAGKATVITVRARGLTGQALTKGGDTVVAAVSGANPGSPVVTDNANGTYSARYVPLKVGTDIVAITLNGTPLGGSPYQSAVASKIVKVGPSRNTQAGIPVGSNVPYPPSVKVSDGTGAALAGVSVTFTVLAGGGAVAPTSRITDAKGVATVDNWTVGSVAGTNTLRAGVSTWSHVDFTAISQ